MKILTSSQRRADQPCLWTYRPGAWYRHPLSWSPAAAARSQRRARHVDLLQDEEERGKKMIVRILYIIHQPQTRHQPHHHHDAPLDTNSSSCTKSACRDRACSSLVAVVAPAGVARSANLTIWSAVAACLKPSACRKKTCSCASAILSVNMSE